MQYSRKSIAALAMLTVVAFTSCRKDEIETPPVSAISFVNASTAAPSLNVLIGSGQVNNGNFAFGKDLAYVNAYSGEREVSFYQGNEKKITGKINVSDGKFYSLFLTGKWPQAEMVLLKDSLTKPAAGKAHVRFVNMGQDAGELDLGLTNGSTLIEKKAYKISSGYLAVNGNTAYTFVIRKNALKTDTVSIPAFTLEAGHSYTVWAKGLKAETGNDGLGLAVIKNY